MDIILGVVVFVIAFFIFYSTLQSSPNKQVVVLREEASNIIRTISSSNSLFQVLSNNQVNESRLGELKNMTYAELKRKLKVENDFCIYFEDEKGNLIPINNSYKGIGAPDINLSGTPCSQK